MHSWLLWTVHLLLSFGIIAGYDMYYQYLWHRGGRLAQWGLPLSNTALAAFCALCAVVYPDTQRFYLNIAFFGLSSALLDEKISLPDYLVRAAELLLFISMSAILPIAPTTWHWVLFGFVIGLVWLWFKRDYVSQHLWGMLAVGTFFWAIYWQPQTNAPIESTLRVLITFLVLIAERFWLWQRLQYRDTTAQTFQQEADHDHLTNALSYARFRQDLANGLAEGQFNLIMFDLDFFKSVNDEYGHIAGDTVLRDTTALVQTLCHDGQAKLYRTGGEEFAIIASADCNLPAFTRKLWQTIRNHTFTVNAHQLNLSVSVGATRISQDDHVTLDVVRRADANLYLSKRRGRDAVTIDGKTLVASQTYHLTRLFAYYTAPIVDFGNNQTTANVLAVSRFDQHNGTWVDDPGAGFNVATLLAIIKENDRFLSGHPVLRLTPKQFIDPEAITQLIAFNRDRAPADTLTLSLTDRPVFADFKRASIRYHQSNIGVVIVSERFIPYKNARQVTNWIQHYDQLEINLNTLTANFTDPHFADEILAWRTRLKQANKDLIVSGIDNRNDFQTIRNLGIHLGRGRYFAEPQLPRM
ncbi:bifunctional diguanylate cyclase/phosphodiesterase [Lacticaseibacillus sp. GG6-2]